MTFSAFVGLVVTLLYYSQKAAGDDCKIACDNGACVSRSDRCDGYNDCGDYSDEEGCGPGNCSHNHFPCGNGDCVPRSWLCDGDNDCRDYSDEEGCVPCPSDEYTCNNGDCVPRSWVCNGWNDCEDNSDEEGCGAYNCYFDQFTCDNGRCVSESWKCDGDNDCGDNSDEEYCGTHCYSDEFECDNGDCEPIDYECDGYDDCGDNSDEEYCGSQTNVGLAAGLSIGFFLVFIGLSVFVIALVYRVAYHKRQQTVETHVISSTPSTGVTAVDKSLSTPYHDAAAYINPPAVQSYPNPMTADPSQQSAPQYPAQGQAPTGYFPAPPVLYPPPT